MSVNPATPRVLTEREKMLSARRARQNKRDVIVGAYGRQWTPVPKAGWRARVKAGEARKLA